MQIKEIVAAIEQIAPKTYQESYDNCGMQVGAVDAETTGVLLTLDVTEEVLDEAIDRGCNMIVAHHPLIFSSLKRLTGSSYVERIVHKAIKNDIAIYAAHTNLDNMSAGVNRKIADRLKLQNCVILDPKPGTLLKLYTYAPAEVADAVREALFNAGAGGIGLYNECSFNTTGTGTYRPGHNATPFKGEPGGKRETAEEVKIEVLLEKHMEQSVLRALFSAHPYQEVAYELIPLNNMNQGIGAGMVGNLAEPMDELAFLNYLKTAMKTECIRHTELRGRKIERVAVCGGSGSFLLKNAMQAKADIFVTGDFKYHQFFDADGRIIIADIGHFESEQFTPEIFEEVLKKKFPNFAILLSNVLTNPVKYFR